MALGGGVWFTQNKKLPGAYINFVSRMTGAAAVGERGVVAIAMTLDWGDDSQIMELTADEFVKNSLKLFGYEYSDVKMKWLREIFLNARKVYVYKLNSASTGIATCTYATAKHSGTAGNQLKIVIAANADDNTKFDVSTYYGTTLVDTQTVAAASGLVDNDFVTFNTSATLAATSGTSLTSGANATVTNANHVAFMGIVESLGDVNAVGVYDTSLNSVYGAWVKRMRDEVGIKLQVVAYNYAGDYEGIVNVNTAVSDTNYNASALVFWMLGVIGGTALNASATNKKYDGEFAVTCNLTQAQLEAAIDAGKIVLHKVGKDIRILMDINSLVSTSADKGDLFKSNQTIRVIDDLANAIASTFNTKYLGVIPNDDDGRASLWADIVAYCRELERLRAIEDFDEETVTVEPGEAKRAVVANCALTIVNAMEQLYMTTVIS